MEILETIAQNLENRIDWLTTSSLNEYPYTEVHKDMTVEELRRAIVDSIKDAVKEHDCFNQFPEEDDEIIEKVL